MVEDGEEIGEETLMEVDEDSSGGGLLELGWELEFFWETFVFLFRGVV